MMSIDKQRKEEAKSMRNMWWLIALMGAAAAIRYIVSGARLAGLIPAVGMVVFAVWHGCQLYGKKNVMILFLLSWIVSNFFESLSIFSGFPFGNYHYAEWLGPMLANVPLFIMPTYFAMGYLSWIIAHILLRQYDTKLQGTNVFLVPLISSFVMVMWDLVMDPLSSSLSGMWTWENGGSYFGVPLSNFAGWFFVVYLFLQIFAVYLSRTEYQPRPICHTREYWLLAPAVYAVRSSDFIWQAILGSTNTEYYRSMGLICVFTMIFTALISALLVLRSDDPAPHLRH
jgi:putative membrane protein